MEVRMTMLRLFIAGMIVCALVASTRGADKSKKSDTAKLLVGKWQTTKDHKEAPAGTVIEFTKDGKMRVTLKKGGKEENIAGVYTLEGDRIQYTLKLGETDEKKDPLTIKKITAEQLVLKGKEGDPLEFKRIK
jgi:uncharacterized protein (TIGR03066 family)